MPFALNPDGRFLARSENNEIVLLPIASTDARVVLSRRGGAVAIAFDPKARFSPWRSPITRPSSGTSPSRANGCRCAGHRERVLGVAFSPDGEWIATRIARLHHTDLVDTPPDSSSRAFPSAPLRNLQWSPTGEYSGDEHPSSNRDVFLYKITGRGQVQRRLSGHRVESKGVAAHPRLDRISTTGYMELISWDLSLPRPTPIPLPPNPGAVTAIAYSPDGVLLATASWTSKPCEVQIREGISGKIRKHVSWHNHVWTIAFDSKGEQLVCGDAAGVVVVLDVAKNEPVKQFHTGGVIRSIVWLDHPRSIVTHGKDAVYLFDLESDGPGRKVELGGGEIRALAADLAGTRLIVTFQNGALASYSLPDLSPAPRIDKAHGGDRIDHLAISPAGRLFASAGDDHRMILRDAQTLEPLLSFPIWAEAFRDLTFDAKGQRLAAVGTSSEVDVWDLNELEAGLADLGLSWRRK